MKNKSVAAYIPGVNVWEHIVMFFAFYVGLKGFFGITATTMVLGYWAPIYWGIMTVCPILFELGQFYLEPVNGLFLSMFAIMLISGSGFAVFAGYAVVKGTLAFSGGTTLLAFAIGGLARVVQMFVQLDRLQRVTTRIRKERDGFRDNGPSDCNRAGD